MTHRFICLADHAENIRWQSTMRDGQEGCGREFIGKPGPNACPFCGALYVRRIQ